MTWQHSPEVSALLRRVSEAWDDSRALTLLLRELAAASRAAADADAPKPAQAALHDEIVRVRQRKKQLLLVDMDALYGLGCELPGRDFKTWGDCSAYTAHTILVVDTSGSMRTTDVATEDG